MSSPPFFDLDEPEPEPLNMAMTPSVQPPQSDKAKWIKLALIAPFLAKGGPGALEGFLSGMNAQKVRDQALQQRYDLESQRINQQNAQTQALAKYRQDTLAGQEQSRQQALLKQFGEAMSGASTPDEVQALRLAYTQQAQAIGMRPGAFDSLALAQTPNILKQRRIAATWAKLPAESKQEALKNGWTLNVDGEMVPFEQWSAQVGGFVDPATGKPPVAPEKAANTDKRGFVTKDVTVNGKRMLAGFDPDKNQYFAPGDTTTPLTGDIQEYQEPKASTGPAQISPTARANVIGSRRNQWTRFQKAVLDRQSSIQKIDSGVAALERGNRNAATQAIIIGFNKLLDETSVVREGEYARTEALVPLISRIEGGIQRITLGGASMTDADLRALATEAKNIANSLEGLSQEAAANMRQSIEEELADYGIPPTRVFGNSQIGRRDATPERPNANGRTRGAGTSKPNPYRPTK